MSKTELDLKVNLQNKRERAGGYTIFSQLSVVSLTIQSTTAANGQRPYILSSHHCLKPYGTHKNGGKSNRIIIKMWVL